MRIQNRHNNRKVNNRGLTLIEILLAVSILSIISLSVFNVLHAGLMFEKRGQGKSDLYHGIKSALDLMSKDLENMVLYDFSNSYPERTAFDGSSTKVKFLVSDGDRLKVISYYLDWPQQGEVHTTIVGKATTKNVTVNIQNQTRHESYDLIREETDLVDELGRGSEADAQREVIAQFIPPGGLKFYFGYVAQPGEGASTVWKDKWSIKTLPRFVRFDITFGSVDQSREIPVTREVFIPHGNEVVYENE